MGITALPGEMMSYANMHSGKLLASEPGRPR